MGYWAAGHVFMVRSRGASEDGMRHSATSTPHIPDLQLCEKGIFSRMACQERGDFEAQSFSYVSSFRRKFWPFEECFLDKAPWSC